MSFSAFLSYKLYFSFHRFNFYISLMSLYNMVTIASIVLCIQLYFINCLMSLTFGSNTCFISGSLVMIYITFHKFSWASTKNQKTWYSWKLKSLYIYNQKGWWFFLIFIFTLFYFTILYWFCHTLTWISHGCTWVPNPEPSSHLPPHIIYLDHPRAPAPSILYPVSNLD